MEVIPVGILGDGALSALVGLAVWMVLTGRLVPRRTYDDLRKANDALALRNQEQSAQISSLLEVGRVTGHVMDALRPPGLPTAPPTVPEPLP